MAAASTPNTPRTPPGVAHGLFDAVVILKGLNGVAEIASGITLLILQAGTILTWITWLTQRELIQDPHDHLAIFLQHWAAGFGPASQQFAGFYLLAHGIVKVVLAALLFMEKIWAFPLALALFSLLVAFSIYRLNLHWSWSLAGFVAFDILTIGLIAREWRAILTLNARVKASVN